MTTAVLRALFVAAFGITAASCAIERSNFTVHGDIAELANAGNVVVQVRNTQARGPAWLDVSGSVLRDGSFQVTGWIDEPQYGRVVLYVDDEQSSATTLILEPGANIAVRWHGDIAGLATEGGGLQNILMDSWRFGRPYMELIDEYETVMTRKRELEDDDDSEEKDHLQTEANRIYGALNDVKMATLDELALQDDEPLVALLAMEMGALGATDEALIRLGELAPQFRSESIARRFDAKQRRIKSSMERTAIDESMSVGETAPDFTIADLNGADHNLYSILRSNELVLVDFWASWCGPCIKTFPHLKEMYSEYGDLGFEVVAISIDSTHEEWQEASVEQQIPWIDLGDISDVPGPVMTSFGVTSIPKGYVLNASGEIVAKDLSMDDLGEFLSTSLGNESSESVDTDSSSEKEKVLGS